MHWAVKILNKKVEKELDALPNDMRAKFIRITELIKEHGLTEVKEPYVKHVQGSLWEMRMKGKDGISRALYICARSKTIVVLRVFIKKTQKTPTEEIKIALKRAKEIEYD